MSESTAQIRQRIRAERRALRAQDVLVASLAIADDLCALPAIRRASAIAVYTAVLNEVDCGLFASRMEKRGKKVYTPILRKKHLLFAPLGKDHESVLNRYGIPEPACLQRDLRTAAQLDVIITPLVAFDESLNRIGMGGGYYDRTLAFRKRRTLWRRPLTIGVAYSFQKVPCIEAEAWDVPLDAVITEKESYGSY